MHRRLPLLPGIVAVFLIVASVPTRAGADEDHRDERSPTKTSWLSLDTGVAWLDRAPPITLYTPGKDGARIGGLPDNFVNRSGSMYAVTLRVVERVTPWDGPLIVPLIGISAGFGGGGYGARSVYGTASYRQDDVIGLFSIELPGIGLHTEHAGWRALVAVSPAIDFVGTSGHLNDTTIDTATNGSAMTLGVRAQGEVCLRGDASSHWWCLTGGPNLFQGGTWINGGFVGAGATF